MVDMGRLKEHIGLAPPLIALGLRLFGAIYQLPILSWILRLTVPKLVNSYSALVELHTVGTSERPLNHEPVRPPDSLESGTLECHRLVGDTTIWKTAVVGSGPGAGVASFHRVSQGKVIVIEMGTPLIREQAHHGVPQLMSSFRFAGQELILGPAVIPFAQGETVGGGGAVNSGLFHSLPKHLEQHWFSSFTESQVSESRDFAKEFLSVEAQSLENLGIYKESPLVEIGRLQGLEGGVVPRWRKYDSPHSFHHCNPIEDLASNNSEISVLASHKVVSIAKAGRNFDLNLVGPTCSHRVKAENIVLSAGTLGTPELLSRSGLAKASDFSFSFHPMIRIAARFSRPVNDLVDIDPHQFWTGQYGLKIGAAVGTPSLLRATFASQGLEIPTTNFEKVASYYVSFRPSGRSGLLRFGNTMHPYFIGDKEFSKSTERAYKFLKESIQMVGGSPFGDSISLTTVHVFGTIPFGRSGLVDMMGNLVGFPEGKFSIRDASLLPSPPLVNPQGPLVQLIDLIERASAG